MFKRKSPLPPNPESAACKTYGRYVEFLQPSTLIKMRFFCFSHSKCCTKYHSQRMKRSFRQTLNGVTWLPGNWECKDTIIRSSGFLPRDRMTVGFRCSSFVTWTGWNSSCGILKNCSHQMMRCLNRYTNKRTPYSFRWLPVRNMACFITPLNGQSCMATPGEGGDTKYLDSRNDILIKTDKSPSHWRIQGWGH